ncbi:hypothetical protein E0Z10_g8860 [Xylaria hypoxylon]|uniref:Uncharacterized protein n=1 Tax=Xylaria hypoxylon TaxID=37992 RepID=A0A4Z0Y7Y3_9PEZI|nr:hypothetical protein E0Z10_g8860 [Xylaria hypoxylon]
MDSDEDIDTATAMAEAMGFSSFGAQKPNKRRKFNPGADAFVAPNSPSTSTSTLPFHRYNDNDDGSYMATTGSNTIPLGVRRQNVDEIDLDGDEEEVHLPLGGQVAQPNITDDDDDPEPQYLDTSRPSAPLVVDPADALQSKIDTIVGSSADAYTSPQLPPPPPSSTIVSTGHSSRGGRGGRQHNMNREGRSGARWWEDYYDPAFIVNPWDRLEKANGLEPRGSWVSWEEAKTAQV